MVRGIEMETLMESAQASPESLYFPVIRWGKTKRLFFNKRTQRTVSDREDAETGGGKLEDDSYLIIAVSPWRMVILSVARCISTLRTGNPVGIRHSSLKKEAWNCLQHDLRPACMLKHRSARSGAIDPTTKNRRQSSCPDFSEHAGCLGSKADQESTFWTYVCVLARGPRSVVH